MNENKDDPVPTYNYDDNGLTYASPTFHTHMHCTLSYTREYTYIQLYIDIFTHQSKRKYSGTSLFWTPLALSPGPSLCGGLWMRIGHPRDSIKCSD